MSGEIAVGGILVGCSLVLFMATLAVGIPTVLEFFAGIFVLAAGLALILYGLPAGAAAWGLVP